MRYAVCGCGQVFKENEDYKVKWTEGGCDWLWSLVVEMESGGEVDGCCDRKD